MLSKKSPTTKVSKQKVNDRPSQEKQRQIEQHVQNTERKIKVREIIMIVLFCFVFLNQLWRFYYQLKLGYKKEITID